MKQISFVVILLLALSITTRAANDKEVIPASLKSATVYRMGAELVHIAKVTLDQGNNEVTIEGISNNVNINTIQIGNDGNVTILSREYATNFLTPVTKSTAIKRLEDSLDLLNKELIAVRTSVKTNEELLDLLKANKAIGGTQTGLSVAELTKMMDYYRQKATELQKELNQYKEKEAKLLELHLKVTQQLREEEKKNIKTIGRLQLQVFCPIAGTYNFTVSYITPLAAWNPAYDLRVENINKPVKLAYKAKVVQTTGLDWKNVKLTLATSVPNQNTNAPELKSWFLSYQYPKSQAGDIRIRGANTVGSVSAMQEVVVVGYGAMKKEDAMEEKAAVPEPIYVVNGTIMSKREFNKIDKNALKDIQVLKDASASAIYGSRAAGGAILATLKDELSDYVSVSDNELNVTFEIDLPYDVPTNGKEQSVALKEFTVPATYQYFTAPRADKDAYLLGAVADWEKLNLLPGEANVIFEGTYIGKTQIDPNATLDTLNFTLGKDKRVVVTREKLKDFSSVKFLGSNKKQTFTYEITVKNNKKEKVQLLLKDQYPISTNKDIEVEVLDISGATAEAETGLLSWKLELAPGESKKLRLSYSVKYPKEREINVN